MTDLKRRSFIAALGAAAPLALPLLSQAESLLSRSNDNQTPANPHFTATTDLNTHNPTAIVSLRGLGVACFGPEGYESGFIPHGTHAYWLEIKESGPGTKILLRARQRVTGDIRIEVDKPVRRGVFTYERGPFSRPNGSTDDRHFRWLLDIEGDEMHQAKLTFKPTGSGVLRMQRVIIPHATFYTKTLGSTVYARVDAQNPDQSSGPILGRVAQDIGAVIECTPETGSGIRILRPPQDPIPLPRVEGLKYEINLYNLRERPHPHSDFRLYYSVLQDTTGNRQFDLTHVNASRSPDGRIEEAAKRLMTSCIGRAAVARPAIRFF